MTINNFYTSQLWVYNLFPIPVIRIKFDNHKNHKFDFSKLKNKEKTPKPWECKVYSTYPNIDDNDKIVKKEKLELLKKDITDILKNSLKELKCPTNFYIGDFWYNVYSKDFFQESHTHLPAITAKMPYWCGVYFYKKNTSIIFEDDNDLKKFQVWDKQQDSELFHFFENSHKLYVEEGDIILFPSYLKHKVEKNNNDLRVTFSFNLYV